MDRRIAVLLSLALTGCPPAAEPAKGPAAAEAPAVDPRQERATSAAQALGKQLKARLKEALQAGGPAGGIEACQLAAPQIAAAVAEDQGLAIGRTSFKLRNPANAAPAWAAADVEARRETPTFREGPDGALRALLPIRLEAACTTCHGPADELSQEVRQALAERYPDDQATGFAEGDLRGWFWVEVPPLEGR
ncbi:MAG: DUF3365 domain-containing protein [Planctomycetes bacterium]|nr:DUF3365 domain-containing protein [Planctomycetota bacterium]